MLKSLLSIQVLTLFLTGICSTSASADSSCVGTGNTTFTMQNINLYAGRLPSVGETLYTSPPYTVNYTCSTQPSSWLEFAPTLQVLGDFQTAMSALTRAGLGLNIIIKESDQSPIKWEWWEIQQGKPKPFGAPMPDGTDNIRRSATFQLQLVVEKQINSAQIVQIGSLTSFSIIPSKSLTAASGVLLTSTPFAIRYMPDNFGTVSVSPASISLGHVYTDYPTSTKPATFTVEASQRAGAGGPDGSFTIPLQTTFSFTGKKLADGDQAAVMTTSDGQENGLALYIIDNTTGQRLTFNQPSDLGTLVSKGTGIAPTPVSKKYAAVLKSIPGAPLKTGPFSADVVATVTYQ